MNYKYLYYLIGLIAEYIAIIILLCKGHKIIFRRKKTPLGEIDILTKKNDIYHIFEVKYRKKYDNTKIALIKSKQRLIKASLWLRLPDNTKFMYFIFFKIGYEIGELIEL